MNKLLKVFAAFLLLVPGLALAGVIHPPGGTDWDMYVYGNARVVFDILNSVKMLVNPDFGNSGFRTLLLLLATIGFVVLAISAGFDPGKNLLKMFGYIFTVWFISFGTTTLTANVVIQDQSRSSGMLGVDPVYRVDAVPALIVMPAVLTSLVGKYFTESMETYFTLPGELKMSGGAVGQYNLFGRMMQESSQYVITSPELKRSVAQYVGDCVVPAMALGRFQGTVATGDPAAPTRIAYGSEALLKSQNLWVTLGSAKNKSILTKYYPFAVAGTDWVNMAGTEVNGLPVTPDKLASYRTIGALMSCDSAYRILTVDMQNNADMLLQEGSAAWARTGVSVPFQTAMQTMLSEAGAVGTAGQPTGFIMQTALMNTMNGSFRQAAAQTGNSSLLTSVQLAQAEQSQWSAWSAGFSTFNNMMGYVFTVLQAFIFAITPLIIVALMIPGMGKAMFVNYAQILVWLTLWMPMLAIVNFLITLYGSDSVSMVLSSEGGPSMANKALVTQAVNHQMLAAQFLGGMVPMIAWGIVKGAMAFTEFINHGIGNQFAAAAGAGAATGNLSLNNMSMDNTSMNKFSTQASSQVGYQGVSSGANAGSMQNTHNLAGQNTNMNNSGVTRKQSAVDGLQQGIGDQQAVTQALSSSETLNLTTGGLVSKAASEGKSSGAGRALNDLVAHTLANSTGTDAKTSASATIANNFLFTQTDGKQGVVASKASLSAALKVFGIGGGSSMETSDSTVAGNQAAASSGGTLSDVTSGGGSNSVSENNQNGITRALNHMWGTNNDSTLRAAQDSSNSFQRARQDAISESNSITATLQNSLQATRSMEFSEGVGYSDVAGMQDAINDIRALSSPQEMQARMTEQLASMGARNASFATDYAANTGFTGGTLDRLTGKVEQPTNYTALDKTEFTDSNNAAQARVDAGLGGTRAQGENIKQTAGQINENATNSLGNMGPVNAAINGAKTVGRGAGEVPR